MAETVTISARSRNLGYGWTNSVVEEWHYSDKQPPTSSQLREEQRQTGELQCRR